MVSGADTVVEFIVVIVPPVVVRYTVAGPKAPVGVPLIVQFAAPLTIAERPGTGTVAAGGATWLSVQAVREPTPPEVMNVWEYVTPTSPVSGTKFVTEKPIVTTKLTITETLCCGLLLSVTVIVTVYVVAVAVADTVPMIVHSLPPAVGVGAAVMVRPGGKPVARQL